MLHIVNFHVSIMPGKPDFLQGFDRRTVEL